MRKLPDMICPSCGHIMTRKRGDYNYVQSGLSNIVLKNLDLFKCQCGEEVPEIKHIDKINSAITKALVFKTARLTGKELRFIRKQMGFKGKGIALLLNVNPVSVSRWENSNAKIGISNDKLVRMIFIQMIEEQSNQLLKGVITKISSVKQNEKAEPIIIDYKSISESEMTIEDRLVRDITALLESTSQEKICENISSLISKSGLSNHPLVKVIDQLPIKLCPVLHKDMIKEEITVEVNNLIEEYFERRGQKKKALVKGHYECATKLPTPAEESRECYFMESFKRVKGTTH